MLTKLGIALMLLSVAQELLASTCPTGEFETVGEKKFYMSTAETTWPDGKNACPSGTKPITFQTKEEFDLIYLKSATGKLIAISDFN